MKIRKEDANGDKVFGHSDRDFWQDAPDGVALLIQNRLRMLFGEWFIDQQDGTPWNTQVLGKYTEKTRDLAIQGRVLGSEGVLSIDQYNATLDRNTRKFMVTMTVTTNYGQTTLVVVSPI